MTLKTSTAASPRDIGIDSLRGLMLVGMAMNHIASLLQKFTDHPLGYTTSAEGFVFLSGLVAGLVYTRRRQRLGPTIANRASYRRACTIYWFHLALFVGVLVWTHLYLAIVKEPAGNTPPMMLDHPWVSLISGALLINQPPLLDILPMYAGFMLLLPAILAALDAGHHWRILSLSLAAWFLTNLCCSPVPLISGVVQIGAFNLGAWQFLFVFGAMLGHAKATHTQLLPRWKNRLVWPALILCAYGFLLRHWYVPAPFGTFADWVNKNNLAPARLLNTVALFFLVHLAFTRWPRAFQWRPLALLGRHSLAVFSTHVAVAYVLYAFPQFVAATPARTWVGTAIMLGSMFIVARLRQRVRAGEGATAKKHARRRMVHRLA